MCYQFCRKESTLFTSKTRFSNEFSQYYWQESFYGDSFVSLSRFDAYAGCMKLRKSSILNMEYSQCILKELTLKLGIYYKFAAFSMSLQAFLYFLDLMGRFSHTVPGPKNFASPPLHSIVSFSLFLASSAVKF